MIEIKSLRAADSGSVILCEIKICDEDCNEKRTYRLLPEQYKELRLAKGEISEDDLSNILDADELCRALRSGRASLAYSASSEAALKQKLRTKGFSARAAQAAVDRLTNENAITEEDDAAREAEKCLRKLWGQKRISAHLWSRGFASEAIAELSSVLEDVDFSENCAELIRKKYRTPPTDPTEPPKKKGCKSSLAIGGLVVVAAMGASALTLRKKKESEV